MFNNFFNDPIIKQLSDAYLDILRESHTREQLEKMDTDELKALASEYADKVDSSKDEDEKKKHREELHMIRTMISDREKDSEDDEKMAQEHEDDIEDKATRQYEG